MMLLFLLVCGHFYADYAWQSDFIAVGKSPAKGILNGVPWYWIMLAHCFIHGAIVAILTNYVFLGLAEVLCHFGIDMAKCNKLISADMDQILHLWCKLMWWLCSINFFVWFIRLF